MFAVDRSTKIEVLVTVQSKEAERKLSCVCYTSVDVDPTTLCVVPSTGSRVSCNTAVRPAALGSR